MERQPHDNGNIEIFRIVPVFVILNLEDALNIKAECSSVRKRDLASVGLEILVFYGCDGLAEVCMDQHA